MNRKDPKKQATAHPRQCPPTIAPPPGEGPAPENSGVPTTTLPAPTNGPESRPAENISPALPDEVKPNGAKQTPEPEPRELQKIFTLLRSYTTHDFSRYKPSAIQRCLAKRMQIKQTNRLADYLQYLREEPQEIETLFKEFLIGVTRFFRDPSAFAYLQTEVIPNLFAGHPADEPVRVWVPGCATGEEAYSLAILLYEHMYASKQNFRCQVFGTDLDPAAIYQARCGVYPASIARDVSTERLNQFFIKEGDTYRIKPSLRDSLVFAEHNLFAAPPFSKLDLISCRNVLIYLTAPLQRRVLALCHYGLKPQGYLFLGLSETVGDMSFAFSSLNRKWRVFQRVENAGVLQTIDPDFFAALTQRPTALSAPRHLNRQASAKTNRALIERLLLTYFKPAAVLVDQNYELRYVYGQAGRYLRLPPGHTSLNIVDMARPGLKLELMALLRRVNADHSQAARPGLWVETDDQEQFINLRLQFIPTSNLIMIIFEPATAPWPGETVPPETQTLDEPQLAYAEELEREVQATKIYLQAAMGDLQTTNDELKSANEKLCTVNEELQSANEELKIAEEEERSINQGLNALNFELQIRNKELTRAANDLHSLLNAARISAVFLDNDLRIRSFTPEAAAIVNLIDADRGRPLKHMVTSLRYPRLMQDAEQVLRTLHSRQVEVESDTGQWYNLCLMPYRTIDNTIDGVVITFQEISRQTAVKAGGSENGL